MALFALKKQAQDRKPLTLHELVHCDNPYIWVDHPRPNNKHLLITQKPAKIARILLSHHAR